MGIEGSILVVVVVFVIVVVVVVVAAIVDKLLLVFVKFAAMFVLCAWVYTVGQLSNTAAANILRSCRERGTSDADVWPK